MKPTYPYGHNDLSTWHGTQFVATQKCSTDNNEGS